MKLVINGTHVNKWTVILTSENLKNINPEINLWHGRRFSFLPEKGLGFKNISLNDLILAFKNAVLEPHQDLKEIRAFREAFHILNDKGYTDGQNNNKNFLTRLVTKIKHFFSKKRRTQLLKELDQLIPKENKKNILQNPENVKPIASSDQQKNEKEHDKAVDNEKEKKKTQEVLELIEVEESEISKEIKHLEKADKLDLAQVLAEDTRLKELLQNLLQKNATDEEVSLAIAPLLLQVERSVELTEDHHKVLVRGLNPTWIKENAKFLSPNMMALIVENSIKRFDLIFIQELFFTLTQEPAHKQKLVAFTKSFPAEMQGITIQDGAIHRMRSFLLLSELDQHIFVLKSHLSFEELKHFIQSIFNLIVFQGNKIPYMSSNFKIALSLADKLAPEYRDICIQILCGVNSIPLLMQMIDQSKNADDIIQKILENNSEKADEGQDVFFEHFLKELMIGLDVNIYKVYHPFGLEGRNNLYEKVLLKIEAVFKNASPKRQQILVNKLPVKFIVQYFELLPNDMLKVCDANKLLDVLIEFVTFQKNKLNENVLRSIAEAFKHDSVNTLLAADHQDLTATLLPLFSRDVQVQILHVILDNVPDLEFYQVKLIESAKQLPSDLWEEASKKNQKRKYDVYYESLPPQVYAAIVNGQVNNKIFVHAIWISAIFNFIPKEDPQEAALELQKEIDIVNHLKPEFFEYIEPFDLKTQPWSRFLKVLEKIPDQEHAKKLLIASTKSLFNYQNFVWEDRDIFYSLSKEQMGLLPIEQYKKPEIRLLIACLTEKLNDQTIGIANSLSTMKLRLNVKFFNFFQLAYEERDENFKRFGIKYLKNFIFWIVNRDSISPLEDAWKWINDEPYVLLKDEIKNDEPIQKAIKRLDLVVKVPK